MQQKKSRPTALPVRRSSDVPVDLPQARMQPLDGVDYGALNHLMGYALRRAQNALYLHFQRSMPVADVSPQRFAALALVVNNPGIRQGLLGEAMGLHRSGALRLVDWLDSKGWVCRCDDPLDRRSWCVEPTAEGKVAYETLQKAVQSHDDALMQALGADGGSLPQWLEFLAQQADALYQNFPESSAAAEPDPS